MAQMSGLLSENLVKNEGLTRLRYKRISNINIAMEEPDTNRPALLEYFAMMAPSLFFFFFFIAYSPLWRTIW